MASIGKWPWKEKESALYLSSVIEERCNVSLYDKAYNVSLYAKLSSLELILHDLFWSRMFLKNLMKAIYIILRKVYIHKIFLIFSESLVLS